MRTTISCRFFAPLIAFALALDALAGAAAEDRRPLPLVPDAVRWSVELPAQPVLPPVLTGQRVFVVIPPGIIAAFSTIDGAERWKVELTPDHPVVFSGDHLFVAAGEAIHALSAETGAVAWRQKAGTLTAPLVVQGGWIISALDAEITARRASDGTVVWTQNVGPLRLAPTIDGDTLYLPLADKRVVSLELTSGRVKWERRMRDAPSEIMALGRRVYVGSEDKWFYCLDAKDGEPDWHRYIGTATIGRPAIDSRHVYFTAMDNYVRALDRRNGAIRWQYGLPFRPIAGPDVVGTVVVVPGSADVLQALDAVGGKPVKPMALGAPLASAPSYDEIEQVPLAAAITGALNIAWRISLFEPGTQIPTAPFTSLPGLLVPLPPMPQPPRVAK